jgi:hypothetical protein
MSHRLAIAVSGSVCTVLLALTGCAASTPSSPGGTPARAAPSTSATSPRATSSAATASSAAASPTAPTGTGYLTVTVGGLPSSPALTFGGPPMEFSVTLRNGTNHTYSDITPLVSIGHCTCSTSPARMAPMGTLAELDPATGSWHPVFYDRESTGMDYIMGDIVQQPPFALGPGATARFTFRIGLSANQGTMMWLNSGQTAINVTVIQLPGRTWIGSRPAASASATVITR